MRYIDVRTAANLWGISERRVTMLCRNGRIEGALKENGIWCIPNNIKKPEDGRSRKKSSIINSAKSLPLPIGVSNYKELVSKYYYVDKTLLLKEVLDIRSKVSLFTRPRRFGKTLAMDMIKTFFEISDTDNSKYFRDKKIWSCGEKYRKEQGKYPVISITFKDIKFESWEQTFEAIKDVIAKEYRRHLYILESKKCNEYDKKYFQSVLDGTVTEVGLAGAFSELSYMLNVHYGKAAVIIIDEYDTPIQQGYTEDYYEKIIGFMRNLLSGAFKDNSNLAFGFMTGILRVAKESIFSGLNNIMIYSVLDKKYSEYFGFIEEEVREMAYYYKAEEKFCELCEWYDGYRFGDIDIFNPWTVMNYFCDDGTPKAYWQSTGDNSIIRQIVTEADEETTDNLRKLMQGQIISTYVDTSVIYPEIKNNPTTIYSFLLAAGYLKIVKKDNLYDNNAICDVAIPNKEIFFVYEKEILRALSNMISQPTALAIQQAIIKQDILGLQENLQKMLLHSASSFDYGNENFYHGLMLGICAVMNNLYRVESNKESGYGRYDIQLRPYNKKMPGIIMELKVNRDNLKEDIIGEKLEELAEEALMQIEKKQYETVMKQEGFTQLLKLGVSFYKKHVRIISKFDS